MNRERHTKYTDAYRKTGRIT